MRAGDVVRRAVVTVDPSATLVEAARIMGRAAVGALVVVEHGEVVGVATDRDIAVRGVAQRYPVDARIDSVMSTDVRTVPSSRDLEEICHDLAEHCVRRLVVLEGREPVGVVSSDDVLVVLAGILGDLARPIGAQATQPTGVPAARDLAVREETHGRA